MLTRQLEKREGDIRRLEAKLAQTNAERERAAAASEATAERLASESEAAVEAARTVARDLWAVMPGEAKVALFESGAGWVPEWIRPQRGA